MSASTLPRRPRKIGPRRTIAVVASLYNEELVNALIESTNEELVRIMPSVHVPLFRVPGAFEIPVTVKFIMENAEPKPDAIIALGVVIRGETQHADLVGTSVTNSLQELSIASQIPVVHEVLLVDNREQAVARCSGDKKRGVEAAKAAVTMAELFGKLRNVIAPTVSRKPVIASSNG